MERNVYVAGMRRRRSRKRFFRREERVVKG
jgi:hypothetical protein